LPQKQSNQSNSSRSLISQFSAIQKIILRQRNASFLCLINSMAKFSFKTLTILLLFLLTNQLKADVIGGEISYKQTGNKKYEITLKVYRECNGLALKNIPIFLINETPDTMRLPTTRVSIQDISINCLDTGSNICKSQNTNNSNTIGLELHTFIAEIDFNDQKYDSFVSRSCVVHFGSYIGIRKLGGILTGPYNTPFYIEAMINLCKSKYNNSSVEYPIFRQFELLQTNPFGYSFAGNDYVDFDSIDYKMATPKVGFNIYSPFTYGNPSIPITPYCPPNPAVTNCRPIPSANPPRGFYFDYKTGTIFVTPMKYLERPILNFRADEYRTDSLGKKIWLGYSSREFILTVSGFSGFVKNAKPNIHSNHFEFKVGEKKCYEINAKDAIGNHKDSANNGEETQLTLINPLPGATFFLKDSSAKQKIGVYCFKMTDGFYDSIKNKDYQLAIFNTRDNFCPINAYNSKSFFIRFLPPDSVGKLKYSSFLDQNNDGIRNNGEPFIQSKVKLIYQNRKGKIYQTATNGKLTQMLEKGSYTLSPDYNYYLNQTTKDTTFSLSFRDSVSLELGFVYKSGIYGRVYEDKNKNCVFDNADIPLMGYKIKDNLGNNIGISGADGLYYIAAKAGNHQLSCLINSSAFDVSCPSNNFINISTLADSAYFGLDFAIEKNNNYSDIEVNLHAGEIIKGESVSIFLNIKNNGNKTRKAIPIALSLDINNINGTNNWKKLTGAENNIVIDSVAPFSEKNFSFKIDEIKSKANFSAGHSIFFQAKTDQTTINNDSNRNNNKAILIKVVNKAEGANFKQIINDSSKTTIDKTIDFSISFVNSGIDTLNNVIISDTIDLKHFNLSMFNLNFNNKKCKPVFVGNVIYFEFEKINLLKYEKDINENNVFLNFTLGLNSDIEKETSFENQATIDFEFTNKVATNIAKGNIISPVKILRIKNTSTCLNDSNLIVFEPRILLAANNQTFIELSDSQGLFGNPMVLGYKNTNKTKDSLQFKVPRLNRVGNYLLRTRTTNPYSVSIDSIGIVALLVKKSSPISISCNLINNGICEKELFALQFNSNNPHQLFKNNQEQFSKGIYINYFDTLKPQDVIKIVIQDTNNSCTDTMIVKPDVHPLPQVYIFVIDRKDDYCENETIQLGKYFSTTYNIFLNGNMIETTADTFSNIKLTQNSHLIVQGLNNYGCSSFSDSIYLRVHPLPVAELIIAKNKICNYDSVEIKMINEWEKEVYKNNQLIVSKSFAKRFVFGNIKNQDSFYFNTISDKYCVFKTETKVIEVVQQPEKPILQRSGNTLFINTNNKVDWFFNDTLFATDQDSILNCPSGTYFAKITNSFGCFSQSENYAFINTKVKNNSLARLKIYPNPSNGEVHIECDKAFNLEVFDILGQHILIVSNPFTKSLEIKLNKGVYIFKIKIDERIYAEKVVVW